MISAPTTIYPRYFGGEFDELAFPEANLTKHHLRHYTLDELERLLAESGFRILDWQYHTNPFAAHLCAIWFKALYRHRRLRTLSFPALSALSVFDQLSPIRKQREPLKSAGLALLAMKERTCIP